MEYIRVDFPIVRPVFIDGELSGTTNSVIRVEPGTHTITVGEPDSDLPSGGSAKRRAIVRGTTVDRPLVVEFDR